MARNLEGKVAVVTGSGRGIGRGIALLMAEEGAKVVVNDIFRGPDGVMAADQTVQEIEKAGGAAAACYDSITTLAGGDAIIKTAVNKFGKIDILVNCAGTAQSKANNEMTEADWDALLSVHLKGYFSCARAAMPFMMKQKGGRIINFSSHGAFHSRHATYATAKCGILGLTSSLALALKPYNVTANAIMPSAVTQLFTHEDWSPGDDMHSRDTKRQGPEFVAPLIAYLGSDAARDITGRIIYASGGDICVYTFPLKVSSANVLLRKDSKWTVDEIKEALPPLAGLGG